MPDRLEQLHARASLLVVSLSRVGVLPSICEPELLGGRPSGRVRLVLREEDATKLGAALDSHADRRAGR